MELPHGDSKEGHAAEGRKEGTLRGGRWWMRGAEICPRVLRGGSRVIVWRRKVCICSRTYISMRPSRARGSAAGELPGEESVLLRVRESDPSCANE